MAAHVHRGYWIDIGTPENYLQVHRDVLSGRFPVRVEGRRVDGGWIHEGAVVEPGAELRAPFYVGPGSRVSAQAEVGPDAVLASRVRVDAGARIRDSVLWEGCHVGESAVIDGALLGAGVRAGRHVVIGPGAVLGLSVLCWSLTVAALAWAAGFWLLFGTRAAFGDRTSVAGWQ